jgi:hypothetical protein
LIFDDISPLIIFLLAHVVEVFLFLRFYFLLPFFAVMGKRPSLTPKWMGQLIYIQPTTLEYMRDVVIDDLRARKMIGFVPLSKRSTVALTDKSNRYNPQWETAQTMKYTVDQMGYRGNDLRHGLQLSSQSDGSPTVFGNA